MSKIKIAGVKRKTKYSPNHIGNDGMIFNITAEHLVNMGYEVEEYTEAEFMLADIEEEYIFDMARDKSTIQRLQRMEGRGKLVVNSGYGIQNCMRAQMTQILLDNNIPHPRSVIVDVNDDPSAEIEQWNAVAYWVKRGDSHAVHREDVAYARNVSEVKDIVREFALRNIPNAVVNEHLVGDLVKFYGIADTDFFYWFYPFDLSHSKFGHEAINGTAKEFSFSADKLKAACDKAGDVLNVKIYGGDCVVAPDGSFQIIDFNDWPSFAPCRDEAGPKIAECIHKQIEKHRLNKNLE